MIKFSQLTFTIFIWKFRKVYFLKEKWTSVKKKLLILKLAPKETSLTDTLLIVYQLG